MSKARVRSRRVGRWMTAGLVVVSTVSLLGVSGADAQTSPAVNQPGVTKTEIRVGGVATVTGDPTGNHLGNAFAGTEAYFDYINQTQGGIYGRKLVLAAKRDDALSNNRLAVQGLISEDNVFAALPIAVDLFSGADLLVKAGIPTFGWDINAEWGSESNDPGPPNFFGEAGSFINFSSAYPSPDVWLPKKLGRKRVGVIAFSVAQSADCAVALQKSLKKYPTAKIVFLDNSLPFGAVDYSADVAKMLQQKVNLVVSCLDANSSILLAQEMQKQGLQAIQILPDSYDQALVAKNAQFINGDYVFTVSAPFEVRPVPPGLALYEKWMKKTGGPVNENSLYGWLNADLFVTGLKAAGPAFTRQKVVDAINKMTDYTAGGILPGVNWTTAHRVTPDCYAWVKVVNGKFQPVFGQPGKPFVCLPASLTTIPANPPVG